MSSTTPSKATLCWAMISADGTAPRPAPASARAASVATVGAAVDQHERAHAGDQKHRSSCHQPGERAALVYAGLPSLRVVDLEIVAHGVLQESGHPGRVGRSQGGRRVERAQPVAKILVV